MRNITRMSSTHLAILVLIFCCQSFRAQDARSTLETGPSKPKLLQSLTLVKGDEASMIIDLLWLELMKNSASKGFIIVYCGKVCRYGEIEAHLRGIELALRLKGADTRRFAVISGGYKEITTTEFWIVPNNSFPPVADSPVLLKAVTHKGRFNKTVVDYECCYD